MSQKTKIIVTVIAAAVAVAGVRIGATLEQGWSPQCDNQPADDNCWGVMKVGCVNGDTFDALNASPRFMALAGSVARTRDLSGRRGFEA